MANRRFVKDSNLAGTWYIRDSKDDTLVCILMKHGRPEKQTEAMCNVMLEALNSAVEKRTETPHGRQ